MSKKTEIIMTSVDPENGSSLKITVEGTTNMPFWKDDLKFEAILALMETIDMKNFDDISAFEQHIKETEDMLERVKGWG